MNRSPTTQDVARLSGTSKSTVSRVLVDDPHVLPETRRRIKDAIASLGYSPNPHARALRCSPSRSVAVSPEPRETPSTPAMGNGEWEPLHIMDQQVKLLLSIPHLPDTEREAIRQGLLAYPSGSTHLREFIELLDQLWKRHGAHRLTVRLETAGDVTIVRLAGTLDPVNVAQFEQALQPLSDQGGKWVVDCSGVEHFNSVCLTFLNKYCQEAVRRGGRVAFCGVPPSMEQILHLLGLHRVLPLFPTLDEALASLQVQFN